VPSAGTQSRLCILAWCPEAGTMPAGGRRRRGWGRGDGGCWDARPIDACSCDSFLR
jgi:hypothetical protein